MPLAILAGTPPAVIKRHRGYSLSVPGWDIAHCPSRSTRADFKTCRSDVQKLIDSAPDDGAHIFAFHSAEKERGALSRHFYGRHRLIWLSSDLIRTYGTDSFTEEVKTLCTFENDWRKFLRPKNVKHALVLPERQFQSSTTNSQIWKRAQDVTRIKDDLGQVSRLLSEFGHAHWRGGVWLDDLKRQFDPNGARHGTHLPPGRLWKYCFRLPAGFHFDVTSAVDGRALFITDNEGNSRQFNHYTNVDSHGYLRGGN